METFEESLTKELAKPIYDDALSPLAKQFGIVGENLAKTLRLTTIPLQWLAHQQDRIDLHFEKILKNISKEKLVTPPEQLLFPVIEKLKYIDVEDEIAKLYQNLLSDAFNKDKCQNVHPAFIDIINQISPDEAKILTFFNKKDVDVKDNESNQIGTQIFELADTKNNTLNQRLINIYDNEETKVYYSTNKKGRLVKRDKIKPKNIEKTVSWDTRNDDNFNLMPIHLLNNTEQAKMYISHLVSLNIIKVSKSDTSINLFTSELNWFYNKIIIDDSIYISAVKSEIYKLTEFGELFLEVCINDDKI